MLPPTVYFLYFFPLKFKCDCRSQKKYSKCVTFGSLSLGSTGSFGTERWRRRPRSSSESRLRIEQIVGGCQSNRFAVIPLRRALVGFKGLLDKLANLANGWVNPLTPNTVCVFVSAATQMPRGLFSLQQTIGWGVLKGPHPIHESLTQKLICLKMPKLESWPWMWGKAAVTTRATILTQLDENGLKNGSNAGSE